MPCSKPNCDCAARHEAGGGDMKIGYPCLYPGDWPPEAKQIPAIGKKALLIPEELIGQIIEMRDLQKRFFNGDRSVVGKAKKAEAQVDATVGKILSTAGWTETEWQKRPPAIQQGGLF